MNISEKNTQDDLLLQHEVEIMQGIIESKARYRKVTQAAIAQWVKDFQAGAIKINSVDDFRKLVELDLVLQREEY